MMRVCDDRWFVGVMERDALVQLEMENFVALQLSQMSTKATTKNHVENEKVIKMLLKDEACCCAS